MDDFGTSRREGASSRSADAVANVRRAARLLDAFPEKLVLLGMHPERAEPGLGYLEARGRVDGRSAFHVGAFREKPSAADARSIVRRGGLWNSFIRQRHVARTGVTSGCAAMPIQG